MNLIRDFFQWLFESDEARARRWAEAYLAESVDRLDLEYRLRELDRGQGRVNLTYSYSH